MPTLRPFRALRYDPAVVGAIGAVICPPYDVISPAERARLLARHPHNAVRVELPAAGPSARTEEVLEGSDVGEAGDDPYRHAAETLSTWRRDGVLRREASEAVYVYEQRYRLPGDAAERVQRGFFARLGLEPPGQGIRPHERTMRGPKQDRLRLLRATATNTSPIVLLFDDRGGAAAGALGAVSGTPPAAEATDDAGVRHRLWVVPGGVAAAGAVLDAASGGPLTVADGHHRYETALRYRDERRAAAGPAAGAAVDDPPHEHVLTLFLGVPADEREGPTVLPTHRLVAGLPGGGAELAGRLRPYLSAVPRATAELVRSFSPPFGMSGSGRLGLLVPGAAFELVADRGVIDGLFASDTPAVVRALDVAMLEAVLPIALGTAAALPDEATPFGISYTHDAAQAAAAVASGAADAAFLLVPTPVREVVAVAAAGAVMPQKSTYFHPKAATGLVMYPLER